MVWLRVKDGTDGMRKQLLITDGTTVVINGKLEGAVRRHAQCFRFRCKTLEWNAYTGNTIVAGKFTNVCSVSRNGTGVVTGVKAART